MNEEVQSPATTSMKVGFIFVIVMGVAMLVSVICFYATNQKEFFFQMLQIILGLFVVISAYGVIEGLVNIARATSRDRESIYVVSNVILLLAFYAAFTFMSVNEFIPQWHFPWIVAVGFLIYSTILSMAHDSLIEEGTSAIKQFFFIALGSAALTWGQIALVDYLDTWVFLMIGPIPIPLLGITVVLTGLVGACCILLTVSAIVFHALRLAYSVE